jgi:TPR repeat protein
MISPRRRLTLISLVCALLAACASSKPLDTTGHPAQETLVRAKAGDGSALGGLRDAAGGGSGSAEYMTGVGLAEGWAGKKNLEQALVWWQRAAEHGDADAKNALAVAYAEGLNGPANLDAARRLWEEAAEQGNATAQYNLASLLAATAQTKGDMAIAADWLRRAAEQGDADAQYFLGNLYHNGEGVPRQQQEAVRLWRRAAAQGHAESEYSLGEAYLHGAAGAVDVAEAEKWMRKAADHGHGEAAEALALLSTGVVPETTLVERRTGGWPRRVRDIDDRSEPAVPQYKAPPAVHKELAAAPEPERAKTKVRSTTPRKPVQTVARGKGAFDKVAARGGASGRVVARAESKNGKAELPARFPTPARKVAVVVTARASAPAKAAAPSPRPAPTAVKPPSAKGHVPVAAPRQVAQASRRPTHEKGGKSR